MRESKLFLRFLSITALTAAFAACSDNNEGGGTPPPVTPTKGVSTEAYYKGDYYEAGTGNLWINFISDMEYDAMQEDYVGPGYVLCVDFNTALAQNADFATLAAGTYAGDDADTYAAFTLNVADGDSFLTQYDAAGDSTTKEIASGSVTVTLEEGYYHFEGALKLDDGTDYSYSYIGNLTCLNRSDEGKMSNLEGNVAMTELSQALLMYNGTAFTETSDLYVMLIAGPDYDLDTNYGKSDAMMISVNVAPGSSTGIPSGSYTIINVEEADDYPVGTALSGLYNATYGGYFGSWFYSTKNKQESSVRSGKVTVTNNGNDSYKFDIEMKDGYGHTITGTYSGTCRVEDWS